MFSQFSVISFAIICFTGGNPKEILSSLGNGFTDKMEHIVRKYDYRDKFSGLLVIEIINFYFAMNRCHMSNKKGAE